MVQRDYSISMKNAEASVRMEGCKVTPQMRKQAEDTYSRIKEIVPIISKYTDVTELNTYILNEPIERIVVHEKTVDEDGSKSQRVDIHYKYVGYTS